MSLDSWGYLTCNGPSTWTTHEKAQRQSPINISTNACVKISDQINPLTLSYPQSIDEAKLINTGFGWKVDIPKEIEDEAILTGGPLEHKYKLTQFHCHWGRDCTHGSEHTVDNKVYSAELHFVHWNSDLFSSFHEAVKQDKGLAVLGIFLESGQEEHPELEKVASLMKHITAKGQNVVLKNLDIKSFLPENMNFWTYLGSLTTPPLYESVTWVVCQNPITVTPEQIAQFRQLRYSRAEDAQDIAIEENFRPPQPLCGRQVTFIEKSINVNGHESEITHI